MGFFEDGLGQALLGADRFSKMNVLNGNDLSEIRENFQHIKDLKPGDLVRYKSGWHTTKIPSKLQVVEVFQVFPIRVSGQAGTPEFLAEYDFSILVQDEDGDYLMFALDSRRFERVESSGKALN